MIDEIFLDKTRHCAATGNAEFGLVLIGEDHF
jgi:hypothetical protein